MANGVSLALVNALRAAVDALAVDDGEVDLGNVGFGLASLLPAAQQVFLSLGMGGDGGGGKHAYI
ncbi:hypothetical protein GCM10011297_35270 [Bacterioplanes sanyensis]|nr:hypothetical protein GCM10011297_35270 [Bacterioplanes sanyensis]